MSNASMKIVHQETELEQVALTLGRELADAEIAIDQAITQVARVMARMPEARQKADLSAVVGQHVFNHVGSTIASLTSGRGELVKAHRVLETLRRELHLPEVSYGDKPSGPSGISSEPAPRLRAIAP